MDKQKEKDEIRNLILDDNLSKSKVSKIKGEKKKMRQRHKAPRLSKVAIEDIEMQ